MMNRPVSQHGLSRLIQSPSSVNNRNVLDKRYYISAIQNHMFSLSEEITKLKKQLTENRFEATNYEECKRQAEELSQQMAEHEETLMVYNTAIETIMFKGNKNDIDAEAENIRKSKHEKIQQLELMYSDKLKFEENLAKIEKELETEKQLFNSKIAEMPENMQTQYFSLKQERDKLKREEEILTEKVKSLKKNINIYEQQIFRNEKKHMLYNLSSKLYDLQRRYYKLEEENKIKRSPSQEREYLLEQVKQDRSDVEILKMKCDEQKTELEKYRERLSELEDELSEKNSARLNKYRELLKRQETMSTFLEAFPKLLNDEIQKVKEHTGTIVNSLEYMSRNVQDNNSNQEIDKDPNYIFSLNSKDDIEKEYKKIKTQYNMLKSINERHQSEFQELKTKTDKYNEELLLYEDVEIAKQNLQQQEIDLETRVKTVGSTLKSTLLAVTEAQNRKAELESQLENNESYKAVKILEKKLKELEEENNKMEEIINDSPGLRDFQKFKTKSMAEVNEIFKILKSKYEGKK